MSTPAPKVLVADDDASIRLVLSHALTRAGYEVRATGASGTLLKWAQEGEGDLIVTDVVMPDENVFEVLPRIRRARPNLPIIVMSAQNTLLTAVAAAERGAFEYLPKPFDLDDLVSAARRALSSAGRVARAPARSSKDERSPLTGRSPAMQAVYRLIARLVNTDLPVLVTGEPGVGKGLAARALHELGSRRDAPFVSVRVAGMDAARLERELLGADGAVARAAGGVLHLAELTELSPAAQARLAAALDALESAPRRARVVATTTDDAARRLADGRLRRDLYDRVAGATLRMPPLRERAEDVEELARGLLARMAAPGEAPRALSTSALEALRGHAWPGNVRELENVVRRAAALNATGSLTGEMITAELDEASTAPAAAEPYAAPATLDDHLEQAVASVFAAGALEPGLHERLVQALERPLLRAALGATAGNQIRAAELLGLNRNTLRKRLQELGIRARV